MALSESVRKQITGLVASNRTVLFMKGTPRNPQCGFSAQVVQILDALREAIQRKHAVDSLNTRTPSTS